MPPELSFFDHGYQQLIDLTLPDPLFIHDHDGRMLAVNQKSCRSLGYTREEMLSMTVFDIERDLNPTKARAFWDSIVPNETHVFMGRHRRKDGTVFPVEVRVGVMDNDGQRFYSGSAVDISARMTAERSLRQSLSHARSVLDAMKEGVVLQARDGGILDCNPAAEAILGRTRDQLMGKASVDADWQAVRDDGSPFPGEQHPAMETLRTGRPIRDCVMGIRHPNGDVRWLLVHAEPVFQPGDPQPTSVIVTFADITASREAQVALRYSQADLQTVLDNVPATLGYLTSDGTCRFANRMFTDIAGARADESLLDPERELAAAHPRTSVKANVSAALQGRPRLVVHTVAGRDGTSKYQQVRYVPDLRDGKVHGVLLIGSDVTELHTAHDQLRRLARNLENVREEERREAAHMLHEGIAQDLFAARMTVDYLRTQARNDNIVMSACEELSLSLRNCIEATRTLANSLAPTTFAEKRVVVAIDEHAKFFAQISGLRIEVSESADFPNLDSRARMVLFRAAQEALTNVAKHSDAKSVVIALRSDGHEVTLDVTDDGSGRANAKPSAGNGLGLIGIRERVADLGGTMAFTMAERGGAHISIRLPVAAHREVDNGHLEPRPIASVVGA